MQGRCHTRNKKDWTRLLIMWDLATIIRMNREKTPVKSILETRKGTFIETSWQGIKSMNRKQLINHLELRGFACYDNDSTESLRETAIEDMENEYV